MLPCIPSAFSALAIPYSAHKVGYESVPVSSLVFMAFFVMDLQQFWKVESSLMIIAFADMTLEWPEMAQFVFSKTQVSVVKSGGLRSYSNSS